MVKKREDYISWDEYFMGVALLAAKRSKDPNTQVGACIVDKNNVILTTGYNGFPKGCSDDEFPWDREGEVTKYPFVRHQGGHLPLRQVCRHAGNTGFKADAEDSRREA